MRLARTVIAALVLAATLAACGGLDLGDANLFTLDDEWQLGRELQADIDRQLDLVNDREALALLDSLGQELVRESRLADRPWTFHVVRDDSVNAFNIPGGHVYVNTGLVRAASDASEFMAVLAHETAHGTERHATQQLSRAYGLQLLVQLALGRDAGTLEGIAANIAAGGTLAHYSREAEREADAVGVRLTSAAGYDPEGMVRFFRKLLEMREQSPNAVSQFFSSHPLTETRIDQAREEIAALPARGGWRRDSETFRGLQARVAAVAPGR